MQISEHLAFVASPSLVPLDMTIDRDHLARMTLNEAALEREVLALFDHQAEDIHERLRQMIEGQAADAGEMAHRSKGAARGIGAFEVAAAAETLEQASSPAAIHEAAQGLRDAIRLTRLEIAEILSLS